MARYRQQYMAYFYRKQNIFDDEYVFYDCVSYAFYDFTSFSRHINSLQSLMNKNCISRYKILPDFRGNVILENTESSAKQLNLF